MSELDLPTGETQDVEVELDEAGLEAVLRRAATDEVAPLEVPTLCRYLVYLGAAYLEAERLLEPPGWERAYGDLHRCYGAVASRSSVLRFHYAESARGFADEERARSAHERMAGAYEALVGKMQAEIAVREERVRNLERALHGGGSA
jgi:hypothetical protein